MSTVNTGSTAMETREAQDELETYLLLLLSDSALPTGGFVASSGLESFIQHGFTTTSARAHIASNTNPFASFTLLDFLRESLTSYSLLNLPFFERAHKLVWGLRPPGAFSTLDGSNKDKIRDTVEELIRLDASLEAMLLNHVTRRANKAQGVALLTLYSKAFAVQPVNGASEDELEDKVYLMTNLIDALKAASRRPVRFQGHLPICFAVLAAALGLTLERSLHLHLFLQARAIISSAVRLNLLGPYAAQRLLLTDIRPLVTLSLNAWKAKQSNRSPNTASTMVVADDSDDEDGPATTWPLGEILAARHDQLHSRIFNS